MRQNQKSKSPSLVAATLLAGITSWMSLSPARVQADDASPPIKLAVRIVNLADESGKTTLNADSAKALLQKVNEMYKNAGCAIEFDLEEFQAANPKDNGLEYNTSSMGELDRYRAQFDNGKSLAIIDTGPWSEGMHPANAWTAMPGQTPMGAIFEASVANFYPIVGHELGHYLGLDHVSDSSNMMNPVIGKSSVEITADQCNEMRETAQSALASALR